MVISVLNLACLPHKVPMKMGNSDEKMNMGNSSHNMGPTRLDWAWLDLCYVGPGIAIRSALKENFKIIDAIFFLWYKQQVRVFEQRNSGARITIFNHLSYKSFAKFIVLIRLWNEHYSDFQHKKFSIVIQISTTFTKWTGCKWRSHC